MSFDSSPCPRRGEGRPFQLSPSPKPKIEPSSVTSQVKPRIKFPSPALVEPDPFVFQPKQLFPSPVRGLQSEQDDHSKGHQAVKKGGRRIPGVKMSRQQRLEANREAGRRYREKKSSLRHCQKLGELLAERSSALYDAAFDIHRKLSAEERLNEIRDLLADQELLKESGREHWVRKDWCIV